MFYIHPKPSLQTLFRLYSADSVIVSYQSTHTQSLFKNNKFFSSFNKLKFTGHTKLLLRWIQLHQTKQTDVEIQIICKTYTERYLYLLISMFLSHSIHTNCLRRWPANMHHTHLPKSQFSENMHGLLHFVKMLEKISP